MAALAAVAAPFVIRWADKREVAKGAEDERLRHRSSMIKLVRNKWVTGQLNSSLQGAALLVLGLARRSDVLDLSRAFRRLSSGLSAPLESSSDIVRIFDRSISGLLIIGEPGSGKTTLLLRLAEELLDRAENDSNLAIPVVFNLASWAQRRKSLADWMVDELAQNYLVGAEIGAAWVAQDAIIPLLDGLDEAAAAHRGALVETINTFHHDHGLVPLVVCCRTRELKDIPIRLKLEDAIELLPPTDTQVDNYLCHLEETGSPLADVRANFKRDPTLSELLQSPLMLHVIALAYHGQAAPSLTGEMSVEDRQAMLWDAYVDRMFEQRPVPRGRRYSEAQAREWVYWLACILEEHDQTEFQLDRLAPAWLPEPWPRRARLMAGLVTGILTGAVGCLAFGLTFGWVAGAIIGVLIGLILGTDGGLSGTPKWRSFPTVEQVKWSWRRMIMGLFIGLIAGLVGGAVATHFHGFSGGFFFALAGALGGGLIGGVTSTLRDQRLMPNEGIRRSMRHAARFGSAAAIAACIIGTWARVDGIGLDIGIGIGIAGAMTGGAVVGLRVNSHTGVAAVLSHYAVRLSLVWLRRAPCRYPSFLADMAERLLLRQSGSAYLFVHRLLRDHLAENSRRAPVPAASVSHDSSTGSG